MSATNPGYTPQAGDIFSINSILGGSSQLVTVASASGTQFLATNGKSFDTRSANVSIFSTPNIAAVAKIAASPNNTGSGAVAGVGVNSPAINLEQPYSGLNTPSSNSSGQPYLISGQPYLIIFTSTAAWQVINAAKAVIASGAYSSPTVITFLGVSVQISGAPAPGDTFVLNPLG